MKQSIKIGLVLGLVAAAALGLGRFVEAQGAKEETPTVSAEHAQKDVLKMAAEKNLHVYINLRSGKEYSGKVKEAASHAVVLKNPTGREFYEVYIPLDAIASVEIKVRDR
ncbi:MAG: hypothetical protein HYT79_06990 [Elusimicrobia bacterium]|nr:hypothetical protein [Elusimicrobiota bacterium]